MKAHLNALSLFWRMRGVLDFLHRTERKTITYVRLAKSLGVHSAGPQFNDTVREIMEENAPHEFLCSLIVSSRTGIPSKGYFDAARDLGYLTGTSPLDELLFWADEMKKLGVPFEVPAIVYGQGLGVML